MNYLVGLSALPLRCSLIHNRGVLAGGELFVVEVIKFVVNLVVGFLSLFTRLSGLFVVSMLLALLNIRVRFVIINRQLCVGLMTTIPLQLSSGL